MPSVELVTHSSNLRGIITLPWWRCFRLCTFPETYTDYDNKWFRPRLCVFASAHPRLTQERAEIWEGFIVLDKVRGSILPSWTSSSLQNPHTQQLLLSSRGIEPTFSLKTASVMCYFCCRWLCTMTAPFSFPLSIPCLFHIHNVAYESVIVYPVICTCIYVCRYVVMFRQRYSDNIIAWSGQSFALSMARAMIL